RDGEDRGDVAPDQCGRRRAQPTGDRRHRGRGEADQERQDLSDPAEHADPRSPHHGECEVLCRAGEGAAADRAPEDHVKGTRKPDFAGKAEEDRMRTLLQVLPLAMTAALTSAAVAFDNGRYDDMPADIRTW